jgi:hypothetical protein
MPAKSYQYRSAPDTIANRDKINIDIPVPDGGIDDAFSAA